MDKKWYKLIILVIASHGYRYDEFIKIWRKYDKTDSNIKVFYIYGNNHGNNRGNDNDQIDTGTDTNNDEIVSPTPETIIPGILLKTVYALEYILANYEFDYVLRTNLSSFFVFYKLIKFVDTLPKQNCYLGTVMQGRAHVKFASGAGFFLSKDIVKLIVDKKSLINYELIDDYSIGQFMKLQKIPLTTNSVPRFDGLRNINEDNMLQNMINESKKGPYFHYRIKDNKLQKVNDGKKMERLYQAFYV